MWSWPIGSGPSEKLVREVGDWPERRRLALYISCISRCHSVHLDSSISTVCVIILGKSSLTSKSSLTNCMIDECLYFVLNPFLIGVSLY